MMLFDDFLYVLELKRLTLDHLNMSNTIEIDVLPDGNLGIYYMTQLIATFDLKTRSWGKL